MCKQPIDRVRILPRDLTGFRTIHGPKTLPLQGGGGTSGRCYGCWGSADTVFKSDSPDYLNRQFPNSRGVRHIEGARLFWPEEFPDILAEEARKLWGV
jgi:hypothetical protein